MYNNFQKLTNQEAREIMYQCQNKSKEEIQQILKTPKGKVFVQEITRNMFPKNF